MAAKSIHQPRATGLAISRAITTVRAIAASVSSAALVFPGSNLPAMPVKKSTDASITVNRTY